MEGWGGEKRLFMLKAIARPLACSRVSERPASGDGRMRGMLPPHRASWHKLFLTRADNKNQADLRRNVSISTQSTINNRVARPSGWKAVAGARHQRGAPHHRARSLLLSIESIARDALASSPVLMASMLGARRRRYFDSYRLRLARSRYTGASRGR